jgi:hypothetical protein
MLAAINLDPEEERWYIVVLVTPDGKADSALSRPLRLDGGGPGPWGLLTEDEAKRLADAWTADDRDPEPPGTTAQVVEVYRFDADPDDPDRED